MHDETQRREALDLYVEGCRRHQRKDYEGAIALYRRSIALCPTAEAHTLLGWAYSALDRVDDAIDECHKAISVDPDYGNAYNDIGAYLLAQGQLDEAIPWFVRAKRAPRYSPRHFPFLNLGRLYLAMGLVGRALEEFRGALELCPDDPVATRALDEIRTRLH